MANPGESRLDYPFGDTLPALGAALDVAPGVRWLRMPLPFALDHVNLWLLRDRLDGVDGWTVVDCGVADAATKAAWERVFASALDGLPVLRVIVTHMHPDHVGLAHWLTARWSTPEHACRLWMSATDSHAAHVASSPTSALRGEAAVTHYASHGLADPAALDAVRRRGGYYATLVPALPAQFRRLLDGHSVDAGGQRWHCHVGHGHSPEHIALHCPALGVLIAGDMVLPRISTNVSVFDLEPEADALSLYLASIERLRALPEGTLVLPSHGRPFTGLRRRIDQLAEHHRERLAEVMTACAERPQTAADLLPTMFRRALDPYQTSFAMGEAIAHLNALWLQGRLVRARGDDGVLRFSA